MARDHLQKASSLSKKESNTKKSLLTRKSEMVSLSQSDKCPIIITRLFQFNRRIIAESGYENDYSNRKYDAQQKDYVVKQFCENVEKNASNNLKVCFQRRVKR